MNRETEALNYYLQSLKLAEKINDIRNIAVSLNGIGNVYQNLENYPEALNYFKRSLIYERKNNNDRGVLFNYNNIDRSTLKPEDYRYYKQIGYENVIQGGEDMLNYFNKMFNEKELQ